MYLKFFGTITTRVKLLKQIFINKNLIYCPLRNEFIANAAQLHPGQKNWNEQTKFVYFNTSLRLAMPFIGLVSTFSY